MGGSPGEPVIVRETVDQILVRGEKRRPTGVCSRARPEKEVVVETGSTEVDEFLARLDAGSRESLEQLRSDIRDAAPDATERIGYGVPSFRYRDRPLVSYGAGKEHCSFYVQSPAVMEAHAADLAGYRTSKGTVHFAPGTFLPAALVTRLVQARLAETDAAGG